MSYSENYPDLLVKKVEHVLWLTLNRPEASNAISEQMISSLVKVISQADKDKDIWCLVLTGAGKNFCAGGDIKAMENRTGMFAGESEELAQRYRDGIQQIPLAIESCNTPIIAAVNGAAIGAGNDLACMCDMRIASEKAKFGETFAKLALVPGDGGTFFLQRVVGYSKAMELILTAEVIDAEKALEIGLVNKVVSHEELKSAATELSLKVTSNAPVALAMAKSALKDAYQNSLSENLLMLSNFQGITQRTADHFEALKAFKEKRAPNFTNS